MVTSERYNARYLVTSWDQVTVQDLLRNEIAAPVRKNALRFL